ncbi:MAG: hypothetical protein KKH98_05705 [Spirochaetes bacterium]|nr:hypothetical protein [Spirochaetota bacterium]
MKRFILMVIVFCLASPLFLAAEKKKKEKAVTLKPGDIVLADFEGHPNNLGGEVGVYGDGEPNWTKAEDPHSWYLEPGNKYYKKANVHGGSQSFCLVHGQKGIMKGWASFGMDLGPDVDLSTVPKKVKSLDLSKFKYLVFWVKGTKGGERFKILFRDSHSPSYMAQVKQDPLPEGCTTKWQQVVIPLADIKENVDLKSMDHVGLEFGINIGNKKDAVFYVDDFAFVK